MSDGPAIGVGREKAADIAAKVEAFVREVNGRTAFITGADGAQVGFMRAEKRDRPASGRTHDRRVRGRPRGWRGGHPAEPRVLAVLDWELSTLGHPLADFAYHAMMFRMPPDIVAGLGGADIAAFGIPTEADYLAAYCERMARPLIAQADYDFYVAFNFFRLTAIFHGIKGRVVRGTAASAHAKERAASLPRLIALACESMEACL